MTIAPPVLALSSASVRRSLPTLDGATIAPWFGGAVPLPCKTISAFKLGTLAITPPVWCRSRAVGILSCNPRRMFGSVMSGDRCGFRSSLRRRRSRYSPKLRNPRAVREELPPAMCVMFLLDRRFREWGRRGGGHDPLRAARVAELVAPHQGRRRNGWGAAPLFDAPARQGQHSRRGGLRSLDALAGEPGAVSRAQAERVFA